MALQIAVSAFALLYLIYKIVEFNSWNVFFARIQANSWAFTLFIILQTGLSALNISIEAFKWKQLTSVIRPFRFTESLRQVLWGVRMGIITPARMGEPVAKALLLGRGSRTDGLMLSLAGSAMQNCVIAIAGVAALTVLGQSLLRNIHPVSLLLSHATHYTWVIVLICIAVIIGGSLIFIFLKKNPHWKAALHLQSIAKIGTKRLIGLLGLTVARYMVFTFQMWLVFHFFEATIQGKTVWLIPLYYLVITIIPSFALADLCIRGSVALFIFGWTSISVATIVTSIFAVWIFNTALPAIIGICFFNQKKQPA